jgi:hypothetical protein
MKRVIAGVMTTGLLSVGVTGCGTVNNALVTKTKTVEYYRIFDVRTQADRQMVIDAASNGLGKNVSDAQEATPISDSADLPAKPGRFRLVNPLENSQFAAFAAGGGSVGFKIATCSGAAWTAKAIRNVAGSNHLDLTACLFPYAEGYHLDLYAVFTKEEGGLMQLSRSMANAMVGTPEEWTEKTFLDVVRTIKADTNAEIKYLEGFPKMSGTPWLDKAAGTR